MKILNRIILTLLFGVSLLSLNGCDPFEELYLTLAMDIDFTTSGSSSNIFITENLCLSDFEDYEDNKEDIEEIRYISSAYITMDATAGLTAQSLTITLYQADGSTELFNYTIPNFVAGTYKNNPLEINLTQQQKAALNAYLVNPEINKCFVATLVAINVQSGSPTYFLTSKVDVLTELKIKK